MTALLQQHSQHCPAAPITRPDLPQALCVANGPDCSHNFTCALCCEPQLHAYSVLPLPWQQIEAELPL